VEGQESPRLHGDGFVLPRLETAVPGRVRGTYGPQAVEWLRDVYGMTLRPWQAYALGRALEFDDDGLIWRTILITVARQSGKSWLARGLCMWRLHNADVFGEQQTILHVANKMETAKEVQRPAVYWAQERYGKRSTKTGNQNPGITLPSGDRWLIQAANDAAGVGYSCSMVFVDEAWRIARSVIDDAISPTMAERNFPQLYLVSTAGDSTSDLMLTYRDQALAELEDPRSTLILEWSAPPEADPTEEITWKWASPEWSDKRLQFLRSQFQAVERGAWRREYLNQWIARDDHWLSGQAWAETTDPDRALPHTGTWCVAVEQDFDGMGHAVAIAAVDLDGIIITRVTTHRTIREVDERLTEIRAEYPTLHVQVTPGYVDRLRSPFDGLVGQREAAAATQTLLDLFDRRAFRHDGNSLLADHFSGSTISRRQAGWVLSAPMGRKGIYAARALMFALADASRTPKPVAMIRSRSRS
jgi:hypothetical protein